VCAHVTAQRKHRCEVDLQNGGPVFVGELVRGMAFLDAAAVEQNVDSVAVCKDRGDQSGDGGRGG
jgi:hypothetical protein